MKDSSCGLETQLYLTKKDVEGLKTDSYQGVLNFRNPCSNKPPREIPYSLNFKEDYINKADNLYEGEKVTDLLIQSGNLPDGIFAVNDETAAGALNALKKHNIKVPDEISLMGFTNGLVSTITNPSLSTVEQNGFAMGYKSSELLIKRIENPKLPVVNEIIPTKLIIRESTRKLK